MLTIIETSACYVKARVEFNGVPIIDETFPEVTNGSLKVDHWAISGTNVLKVSLARTTPGNPKIDVQTVARKRRFELVVKTVARGAPTDSGLVLAQYSSGDSGAQISPSLTPVFEQTFGLEAKAIWSWVSAMRLGPYPQSGIPGIIENALAFQRRLENRDIDSVIALQRGALTEMAVATEMTPDDLLGRYRSFLAERIGSPQWKVRPLDASEIRLESMAEGRVVHATREDGAPLFWTANEQGPFLIDPYYANVHQKWIIVR